jgi:hypothetical protein
MAWPTSVFPTALDSTIFPADKVDNVDYPVASDWNGFKDVLINVQSTMGVSGSAVAATLDYKLKNTSSSNPGHKHTLVNGATDVTATAAELNLLDNSVAGAAVASRALVLGADKNVDVLAVADLKLGAGVGTSVSSTAVELNLLDGATTAIVQTVNYQTGAVATGTGQMPVDDTIPQITEGDQYLTLAITPTSATNILEVTGRLSISGNQNNVSQGVALFNGASNALSAVAQFMPNTTTMYNVNIHYRMVSGTTSPTTFTVRSGCHTGQGSTTTVNGTAGARVFGGVMISSLDIKELKV